jgi:hypothetical protein
VPVAVPATTRTEGLSVDPTLLFLLFVVTLAVVAGVALSSRRRRDAALEPTRLGPSWTPTVDEEEHGTDDGAELQAQVSAIAERTDLDPRTVETVLTLWREYLAVLGIVRLSATHRYRLYDPYNPPVASRDMDGRPTPDRERVARDIGNRTEVPERDAQIVLDAEQLLFEHGLTDQRDASS